MTREEIISMAREADISLEFPNGFVFEALVQRLERFAALVASAEREACAALCDAHWMAASFDAETAKICETAKSCAEAIRARGES